MLCLTNRSYAFNIHPHCIHPKRMWIDATDPSQENADRMIDLPWEGNSQNLCNVDWCEGLIAGECRLNDGPIMKGKLSDSLWCGSIDKPIFRGKLLYPSRCGLNMICSYHGKAWGTHPMKEIVGPSYDMNPLDGLVLWGCRSIC